MRREETVTDRIMGEWELLRIESQEERELYEGRGNCYGSSLEGEGTVTDRIPGEQGTVTNRIPEE